MNKIIIKKVVKKGHSNFSIQMDGKTNAIDSLEMLCEGLSMLINDIKQNAAKTTPLKQETPKCINS